MNVPAVTFSEGQVARIDLGAYSVIDPSWKQDQGIVLFKVPSVDKFITVLDQFNDDAFIEMIHEPDIKNIFNAKSEQFTVHNGTTCLVLKTSKFSNVHEGVNNLKIEIRWCLILVEGKVSIISDILLKPETTSAEAE